MIAHDNEGCDLADPRNWRTRSSVHVKMGGMSLQVDAGPEFRMQCLRNDVNCVDAFFLTHGHADHILGMDDLRRFCDLRNGEAIPVYSTEDGLKRVREIYPYAIGRKPQQKGYPAFSLSSMPRTLELPGGCVHSVLLPHGNVQTLGLVFEERETGQRFGYFSDCKSVPDEGVALAKGAEVVALDGLRPKVHPSHMTINEAIETALQIGASKSYLTHMTVHIDHATWETQLPENVFLAYDGLRLSLGSPESR